MALLEEVVLKIKQKKELSAIDSSMIREALSDYLVKNKFLLEDLTPAQLKLVIKDIRRSLREKVGRFQATAKNRYKLLEKNEISSLLNTHSSTKERINFYPQLREIIKQMHIKSILDLGCGINPLALAEPGINYYASDINLEDLDIVKHFFKKNNLKGEVFVCDLTKIEKCALPETELTVVLKVFDILTKKDYETAKKILEKIRSKRIIVSFSTRTLSGKPMRRPRRIWFESLLDSLSYKFEITASDNEVFYII